MVLFLIASLFEALGVGLIYPFIQIIGAPEKIQDYEAVVWLLEYLNWDMTADPIRFFALLLVLVFCVRSGVLISVLYVRNRIIAASRSEMSGSLFESYIRQPHAFHLERNSSELVKNITTTTGSAAMAMTAVLMALLTTLISLSRGMDERGSKARPIKDERDKKR